MAIIGASSRAAHTAAMAVSGTVARARPQGLDMLRLAKRLRRWASLLAVAAFTWFLLQFGAAWVPAGMATVPGIPPGAWCIVDRWSIGARVGSDVFVDTPDGRVLSRIAALDDRQLRVEHPDPFTGFRDSRHFGPLPRAALVSTVMVVFQPEGDRIGDGR